MLSAIDDTGLHFAHPESLFATAIKSLLQSKQRPV